MKLSDLLDELRNNILNDRGVSTGADDKLWSDDTLVRYINEAQRRLARRAFVLHDARTKEVVKVTLKSGVTEYDLHPSIIAVVTAKIDDGRATDLTRVGHSLLANYTRSDIIYAQPFEQMQPGPPLAYATDETLVYDDNDTLAGMSMRIFPVPRPEDAGTVITLRVSRMPLDELTTDNLSAVPEVPSDHHLDMLDWAAYLALRIVDQDAGDPKRAQEFKEAFEAHVEEALELLNKKLEQPVVWGFGRNGYRWVGNEGY